MKKQKVLSLMAYAILPGMSEIDSLKAQLNMAVGLIIRQRMEIATLKCAKKEKIFPHRDI